MIDNLVTYLIHQHSPLPANDALAYQYILADNGVFIRAETRFFGAYIPIVGCTVRGLEWLNTHFQLNVPRIPEQLLTRILADARRARRPDGSLNEVFYRWPCVGNRQRK